MYSLIPRGKCFSIIKSLLLSLIKNMVCVAFFQLCFPQEYCQPSEKIYVVNQRALIPTFNSRFFYYKINFVNSKTRANKLNSFFCVKKPILKTDFRAIWYTNTNQNFIWYGMFNLYRFDIWSAIKKGEYKWYQIKPLFLI